MQLIYQNFDGLDVTFQGAILEPILDQLAEAKVRAQNTRQPAYTELGSYKIPVSVAEAGAPGGYTYRFDTGHDRETWFIAHSLKADRWNIRTSVHSLAFALHGYQGVKEMILTTLRQLDAHDATYTDALPLERISRLDYCFDYLTQQEFNPDLTHFIAHKRCSRSCEGEKETVTIHTSASGDRIETLRIGKMPGRQATIYNKSREIQARNKGYWKEIWKLDQPGTVWRVEVRAGKGELDKWGLKRFDDFEAKAGDVISSILQAMRYTTPTNDSNRGRWPTAPFWQTSIDKAAEVLAPYISHANREAILEGLRQEVINRYRLSMLGSAIGYTAVSGRDVSEVGTVLEELKQDFEKEAAINSDRIIDKFRFAENKYIFLK